MVIVLLSTLVKAHCQKTETVQILKKNNDTIDFETKLRLYQGDYIFPSDSKDFIKGRLYGEKTKLSKSEVKKIILNDGSEYIVLHINSTYLIGFFISKGAKDFFKIYSYGHNTVLGMYGPQMTINKIASVDYVVINQETFEIFYRKKGVKALSENCPKFKAYVDDQRRIRKDQEVEEAMRYFNSSCN